MKLIIYTDGASRSNPGQSASGFLILDIDHKPIVKKEFHNGIKTNNFAEYAAVIGALKKAVELYGPKCEIELFSDSELIVNQLNGNYTVKDPDLKLLNAEAKSLASQFDSCIFSNVPRENKYITMVDKSLNILLDKLPNKNKKKAIQKKLS